LYRKHGNGIMQHYKGSGLNLRLSKRMEKLMNSFVSPDIRSQSLHDGLTEQILCVSKTQFGLVVKTYK